MTSLVEPRGNVAGASPADYTTTFTYDPAGNILTVSDPLGYATTTTYDPVGLRSSVTDAKTHATSYGYDAADHLTSVTDALGGVTSYTYDATANLTSRTDAKSHVTAYAYDLAGRLIRTTDPLLHAWTLTYDPAGNVATRTDANGKTTTYGYDPLNRLTGITYAAGTTSPVTFGYDADGNRTVMTDGAGTETYAYDALDRLTGVTRGADAFAYVYDAAGNLTSRTYPDGTVTSYAYDDDGRMASATSAAKTTTYGYDPAGNVLTALTPDGFTARSTYDRAGRLLEVAHLSAAGLLSRATYALDAVGNRTQMTTTRGTMLYAYDELDRLTRVCYGTCPGGGGGDPTGPESTTAVAPSCIACTTADSVIDGPPSNNPPAPGDTFTLWAYDAVGNRTSETNYLGLRTYAYDADDRLTSTTGPGSASVAYNYDNNGNQLSAGATTYAYDLADRLVRATIGPTTETYTWSGDGIRRTAATGSQAAKTVRFVVDRLQGNGSVAIERDGANKTLRRYVYGLDLLSQTTPTKGPYWYHHDGLGSVTDVTSGTGASLWWTEYTPYGAPRANAATSQAPVNLFRFTGEYVDTSTALYHLRARQYDPTTGRFLSTDPVSPGIGDPYLASYVYVRDSPTLGADPSGQCWPICFAAIGAAIGGTVGGLAYTATHVTDFNGQEALGAVVGGAIAGAATGVAGPLGGSLAAAAGFGAGGAAAAGISISIGAVGGAIGTDVSSFIGTGQHASLAAIAQGALLNGAGGYLAGAVFKTVGIYTAAQAAAFGPHSWSSLFGGIASRGVNSTAIWRQAVASSLWGTGSYVFPWNWGK